jgi:redox-sensitive bicupin YhaK (pirin superfamily)
MLHEDHLGNRGHLKTGGVQWMTAGRGIIHSEMPQQESGAMRGFQLWINLPAKEKMKPAGYQDIQEDTIPRSTLPGGGLIKVIAGEYRNLRGEVIRGPIYGLSTEPLFFDIHLHAQESFSHSIPPKQSAIILSEGDQLNITASEQGAKAIVLAAKPLHEPIVQHGPFVMNTREEIEQAIDDYQHNRLTAI